MNLRIFISSVQKEFAEERRLLKRYISKNPAYRWFFDTFVFEEDVVAADRRTDEVYLEELGKCDIYLGLIGREYGFEDAEGVSPTEREFDEATRLGLTRLLFVLDIVMHRHNGATKPRLPEKLGERRRLIIDRTRVTLRATILELMAELGIRTRRSRITLHGSRNMATFAA